MSQAHRLDAGEILHPLEQSVGERRLLILLSVFFAWQREAHQGGVFRDESGIDLSELHETAREQARAAEKNERESYFDYYQRAAQPPARTALSRTSRSLLQRL